MSARRHPGRVLVAYALCVAILAATKPQLRLANGGRAGPGPFRGTTTNVPTTSNVTYSPPVTRHRANAPRATESERALAALPGDHHTCQPAQLPYGDLLRVMATVAVVVQHVAHIGVQRYGSIDIGEWWVCDFAVAGTKWAVPLFVMLSGALLLDPGRTEPTSVFYRKRIVRVGVPLAFWSAFYLVCTAVGGREATPLPELLGKLAHGRPYYHMYFMFVITGLYLFTPPLRVFVAHASHGQYAVALYAALSVAVCADAVGTWNADDSNALTLFVPYIGYFLAGYWFRDVRLSSRQRAVVLLVLLASIVLTALVSAYLFAVSARDSCARYAYHYFSPNIVIASLATFLLLVRIGTRVPLSTGRVQRLRARCAKATFGIYLIHPFVLRVLERLGIDVMRPPVAVVIPIVAATVFFISWALIELIEGTPYLRRVVG